MPDPSSSLPTGRPDPERERRWFCPEECGFHTTSEEHAQEHAAVVCSPDSWPWTPHVEASRLAESEARVAELEEELTEQRRINEFDSTVPIRELRERVTALEDALRFYGDEANYRWSPGPPLKRGVIQEEDRGSRARAALEGE
jgi:hypothetical protein